MTRYVCPDLLGFCRPAVCLSIAGGLIWFSRSAQHIFNFLRLYCPLKAIESQFWYVRMYIKTVWKRMFLYKWPLYDLLWPFFCHIYVDLPQNWCSDGHFEVLNRSYQRLVQKLWHKTQIVPFLFLLRFCTITDICIFCIFCFLAFLA